MSGNKRSAPSRTRVSLEERVADNLLSGKATAITFVREDGSKNQQPINDAFIKGKKINEIIDDIFSIQHDLCAKYFTF